MSKILVIGGNGFIGKNLVKRLAGDASNDIVVVDRFSEDTSLVASFADNNNVTCIQGDFMNREDMQNALNGMEYVFHLVSTTTPATSNNDPNIDIETNIRGGVQLFELCSVAGIKKVVFISSGGTVYGDVAAESIPETTAPQPRSPYGIGKLTLEHYLRYFKSSAGLDYIVYRVANPYGPGQNIYGKQGVIPIFMRQFLQHEPITIYGDGSMVRDYIYIDDVSEMIATTYASENRHSEYNLGSGTGESVKEIVEAIESCAGYEAEKLYVDTPASFIHKSVLNMSRFTDEFSIKPQVDLQTGLLRTWEYVKTLS
jgi:UDP-glucose 4-epimerase